VHMKIELNYLIAWFQVNKLSLNLTKTSFMVFHPKHMQLDPNDIDCQLKFGNEIISEVSSVKFLGLNLDRHLDWSEHFKVLNGRLGRANYIMNSVKNMLPTACRKTLYYSLFYSHLTYGIHLWGGSMLSCNTKKIFKAQKRSIRIIARANYNAHTDELFVNLNLLKLNDMIDFSMLRLMYLHSKNSLPSPVLNLFNTNRDIHTYNTRHRNDPIIIRRNFSLLNKSFLCKGPLLWSGLNPVIKNCKTLVSFKRNIKKSKIRSY